MDMIMNEDQALQAHIGAGLGIDGIDNEAIDINIDIKQLEDFINNEANFPDETVPPPVPFADLPQGLDLGVGLKQETPQPRLNNSHHSSHSSVPPFQQSALQQVNPLRLHEVQKNPQFFPQLPDSPPDSGSEPYSPPDGNTDPGTYNVKANIVSGMTTLPQHMYPPMSQQNPTHPHSAHPSPPHTQQQHSPPTHSPPHIQSSQMAPQVYNGGGYVEPPHLKHLPTTGGAVAPPGLSLNPQMLQAQYPHVNSMNMSKKRKMEMPNGTVTPGVMCGMGMNSSMIKQEPMLPPDCTEDNDPYTEYDIAMDPTMFMGDGTYQVIKWNAFTPNKWCPLLDDQGKELPQVSYRVDADKGFNFSVPDESFVCQKKNHFQVTIHMGLQGNPRYVRDENGSVKHIDGFYLHFNGVKMESTSQTIRVEQSQSDRSKKPFHPIKMELVPDQVSKITVGRMHFSETTTNNMRKKGKPNPDQRYFLLVVGLYAHSGEDKHLLAAQVSERIIVRASNPGQFDNDVDALWNKGHTPDSVFHTGRVGINAERPEEALTVHGNIRLTGHLVQPSDRRVKTDVEELDSGEQLKRIAKIKVYKYTYNDDFAECAGLSEDELDDTGVIAQEVSQVMPDAVRGTGDLILPDGNRIENFQVVNKDRIYMESVGAVRELCKVTNKLEDRMNELEFVSKRLDKHKRDSLKSTTSTKSTCSTISLGSTGYPSQKKCHSGSSSPNHRHRHHRSRSSTPPAEETGWCSNKFIQITIIVLFLVMAFCLVSITVLYIMERHKDLTDTSTTTQQGDDDSPSVDTNSAGGGASGAAGSAESGGSDDETFVPLVSITTLYILEKQKNDSPSFTPGIIDDKSTTTPGVRNSTWNGSEEHTGINMTNVNKDAPPFTSPRCLREICYAVCCREPPPDDPSDYEESYDGMIPPAGFQPEDEAPESIGTRGRAAGPPAPPGPQEDEDAPQGPRGEEGIAGLAVQGMDGEQGAPTTTPRPTTTMAELRTLKYKNTDNEVDTKNQTGQGVQPLDAEERERINYSISKPTDSEDPESMDVPYSILAVPEETGREKREVPPVVDIFKGVPVLVTQTNKSLSLDYCANVNCQEQSGANYEYYVPIENTFPLAHITFRFMLPGRMFMYLCTEREEMYCPNSNTPHAVTSGEDVYTWDLPVGYYVKSEYMFRVAPEDNYSPEVNICQLPLAQAGLSFAQYKLVFERVVCEY